MHDFIEDVIYGFDPLLPRPSNPHAPRPEMSRRVLEDPVPQYVNQPGYVSLFPFLLHIVDPSSPNLVSFHTGKFCEICIDLDYLGDPPACGPLMQLPSAK